MWRCKAFFVVALLFGLLITPLRYVNAQESKGLPA